MTYSAKFINIPGYMHTMIQKIRERNEPQKVITGKEAARVALTNKLLDYEKKKALSGMKYQVAP